jgi:hypothetical protein
MSSPRGSPPSLAQLIEAGIVDAAIQAVITTVSIGTDLIESDLVSGILNSLTPALLPSTYHALLNRVINAVTAIWAGRAAQTRPEPGIADIPLEPERPGAAGDYTGRILYRTTVIYPTIDEGDRPRTVYIDSPVPLTDEEVMDDAIEEANARGLAEKQYRHEGELDLDREPIAIIEEVTRRY